MLNFGSMELPKSFLKRHRMPKLKCSLIRSILCTCAIALAGLFSNSAFAQQGEIKVVGDAMVKQQISRKVSATDTIKIYGYRIQLYFGQDMQEAQKMKQKFLMMFPQYAGEAYVDYFQPNWKLRVGNFYRKIDAQEAMNEISKQFPNVFLVQDVIQMPAIVEEESGD